MSKYKVGKIVKGYVSGIEPYGAFIVLDEYYNGLIHISEISSGYVKDIKDYLEVGETIFVKVVEVNDELNQVKLSIKDIDYKMKAKTRRKEIAETPLGFQTLKYKLPIWMEQKLQKLTIIEHK